MSPSIAGDSMFGTMMVWMMSSAREKPRSSGLFADGDANVADPGDADHLYPRRDLADEFDQQFCMG